MIWSRIPQKWRIAGQQEILGWDLPVAPRFSINLVHRCLFIFPVLNGQKRRPVLIIFSDTSRGCWPSRTGRLTDSKGCFKGLTLAGEPPLSDLCSQPCTSSHTHSCTNSRSKHLNICCGVGHNADRASVATRSRDVLIVLFLVILHFILVGIFRAKRTFTTAYLYCTRNSRFRNPQPQRQPESFSCWKVKQIFLSLYFKRCERLGPAICETCSWPCTNADKF